MHMYHIYIISNVKWVCGTVSLSCFFFFTKFLGKRIKLNFRRHTLQHSNCYQKFLFLRHTQTLNITTWTVHAEFRLCILYMCRLPFIFMAGNVAFAAHFFQLVTIIKRQFLLRNAFQINSMNKILVKNYFGGFLFFVILMYFACGPCHLRIYKI